MNLIRVAAIVALLFGGQALGESTVMFTLGTGGNNNVADWENYGNLPFVPPVSNVVSSGCAEAAARNTASPFPTVRCRRTTSARPTRCSGSTARAGWSN